MKVKKCCDICCDDVSIKVVAAGACPRHKSGDCFKPMTGSLLCPHAYHIVHPYALTLKNGGWFTWVKKGKNVIAQCPHPTGVIMGIKPGPYGRILVTFLDCRECPRHKKGDLLQINLADVLCPHLFDLAYAHTNACTSKGASLRLFCPCKGGAEIEVRS